MNNKFPGKDISVEDIKTKFPLVAKNKHTHKTKFKIRDAEFEVKKYQFLQGQIWLRIKK